MKPDRSNDPLVSVIVTTKNSSGTLGECLASVFRQNYPKKELIVVDNASTDDTKEIALTYTNKVFDRGPERSAQRNFGVSRSGGRYVLVIDSDMELSEHVIWACVEKMAFDERLKAVVIPEESFGTGFWARCKALERSYYVEVDWMEAARFFDRQVFEELGGYKENLTGSEDYDLPQRIEARYGCGCIGRIDEFILHNEQGLRLLGTCKKKFFYVQTLDDYRTANANLVKYRKQSSPLARYKLFLSNPGRLLNDPLLGIGMLFMKTCEFGSGGIGYLYTLLRKGKARCTGDS